MRHPVWASLARDYLSIMASSVSSERAFSQGGITISKRRNRLKGDIVEALQCLKCSLRHDLLFREAAPTSLSEQAIQEPESEEEEEANIPAPMEDKLEVIGWDGLFLDDDEDIDTQYEGDDESR